MKRLFFGALLLMFTSLAACSSGSNDSRDETENAEGRPLTPGTTTDDVPTGDTTSTLDTIVTDTNVRGNP